MKSLRARAVASGILWALLTAVVGLYGLASFMDRQTEQRFDDLLRNRHIQVIVAVANYGSSAEDIMRSLSDPAYERPFSGEYWQVETEEGQIVVSPSLVDTLLPQAGTPTGEVIMDDYVGPGGERLRGLQEWLTLSDGTTLHVQVASSLQSLREDRQVLRNNLILAFVLVTVLAVGGALLQATAVLRPLNALRRDVMARWEDEDGLSARDYPAEVAPLVTDINTLMDRNREIVTRSRRQAADLAHAIKTPSAIMRNELEQLRAKGLPVTDSLNALDRLDAQLKRSFARMRADGGDGPSRVFTNVSAALDRMIRAFTAIARNQDKTLSADIAENLRARIDQNDFEEVVGNLLDNALKWATGQVVVTALRDGQHIQVIIEDDGPGIPEDEMDTATLSGQRLDTSKPGTGLGLAIAADLAHAYGGKVSLGRSRECAGLCATFQLKASGGRSQS